MYFLAQLFRWSFLEFLNDSKMCILNERVNSNQEDYIFISHLGVFVVGYIAANYNALLYCMTDCVDKYINHI